MTQEDYQQNFSAIAPIMLDMANREPKVRKMLAVLADAGLGDSGDPVGVALDIGCSAGAFVKGLATRFRFALGFDIDRPALTAGLRQLPHHALLAQADSQRMPLPNESLDLVVCNHVYEHVPDAREMFDEIYRVLKPGGACYLGAASSFTPIEPHYRLLFLSWLPKPLAHRYMRVAGRGDHYYEKLRSYWGIRRLIKRFEITDYTIRVLSDPDRFGARDILPPSSLVARIPPRFWRAIYWFLPSYILILKKSSTS